MIERIQSLARKFTELTGNPVIESYLTQGEAREFLNAGFTEDDLALMVRYRRATVKEPHILKAMLRWRFIIGDVQRFVEDLPEAKAHFQRHRASSDRENVMAATGRTEKADRPPRPVARVMSDADREDFVKRCRELRATL